MSATSGTAGQPGRLQVRHQVVERSMDVLDRQGGQVEVADGAADASVAQQRLDGAHLGAEGYTLETVVLLKSLELDPARNATVGFDASVGFPDVGGRVRTRAAHWAGQSEAAVVDRPGSAALLPSTWGTLVFDRSPLK